MTTLNFKLDGTNIVMHLKANSRGSWTNVCSFPASDDTLLEIQHAAARIAQAAGGVSFKITDDHGVTLYSLDCRQQPATWQSRIN